MIWIGFTTRYRGGSDKFARAAATLQRRLQAEHPQAQVVLQPLDRKADFLVAMGDLAARGKVLQQLHFLGHSGMYGIMFGTTGWPEQFSPHEWQTMAIPLAPGAQAHFHACRTARWFAPFFARTFGVTTHGYQNYTTVSTRPDRFAWEGPSAGGDADLFLIACPGRRSHGLPGSLCKYLLGVAADSMIACPPEDTSDRRGYDEVAVLYDRAFQDIRVRRDEWAWVSAHMRDLRQRLQRPLKILDLGCGNGALLAALATDLGEGVGVDVSVGMVEQARLRHAGNTRLSFQTIAGPVLPFADHDFDAVVSFLSFRYLDWDPVMTEIRRVLKPDGALLVVDMVEKPVGPRDARVFARSALAHLLRPVRDPVFTRNVRALTTHPAWKRMLVHNPIRADHEYRWYLESRFPGRKLETLNVGRRHRLVAFDSGPVKNGTAMPLSYP